MDAIGQILDRYGIPAAFPQAALEQAKSAARLRVAAEASVRLDLRGKTVFSFNGAARDRAADQALSLEKKNGAYLLGLHLADVDAYVCEDSPLDLAAKRRGATLYMPVETHYLLPERLALGECALSEGTDRLAVSVFLEISEGGTLLSLRFEESVVRVALRCVFEEIDLLYTSADASAVSALREKYAQLLPILDDLYALGAVLHRARVNAGGVSLGRPQRRLAVAQDGAVLAVQTFSPSDSEMLVEEFFLYASHRIGSFLFDRGLPCMFVGQDPPEEAAMDWMRRAAAVPAGTPFRVLQEKAAGSPIHELFTVASRALLPKPRFSPSPCPHIFTANPHTVRFSHPANRYPDLMTERLLKEWIRAGGAVANLDRNAALRTLQKRVAAANALEEIAYAAQKDLLADRLLQYLQQPDAIVNGWIVGTEDGCRVLWDAGLFCRLPNVWKLNGEGTISDGTLTYPLYTPLHFVPAAGPEPGFPALRPEASVCFT